MAGFVEENERPDIGKPRFKKRVNLGRLVLHNANSTYPAGFRLWFKRGAVFIDLDTLAEIPGSYPAGDYLHIGVSGENDVAKVRSQTVKGHMDTWLPLSELDKFIDLLIKLKVKIESGEIDAKI